MIHERGALVRAARPVAGAVLVGLIALALRPHLSGHAAPHAELRQLGALSARDQLVHGALLLLLGALLTGFARYALIRRLTRQAVLVGLVSFTVGIGSVLTAGLIDGFILPGLVAQFVAASPVAHGESQRPRPAPSPSTYRPRLE